MTARQRHDQPMAYGLHPFRARIGMAVLGLLLATTAFATAAESGRTVRDLLKLVPQDAAVVLTVENLRDRLREFRNSPLASRIRKLPAVDQWLNSQKYEQLEAARAEIERALRIPLVEIRDRILGDAVVLALSLPPGSPLDGSNARGILVLNTTDTAKLQQLITAMNESEERQGTLARLVEHSRGQVRYVVREFNDARNRAPDAYVVFSDGTFALSNSEELIQNLIDRKQGNAEKPPSPAAAPGLLERFDRIGEKLPERVLARLIVDPRLIEAVVRRKSPEIASTGGFLESFLGAMETMGAGLILENGRIELRAVEILHSGKMNALLGAWRVASPSVVAKLDRATTATLGMASFDLDYPAFFRVLNTLIPREDQNRIESARVALKGLLLGQDPLTRIAPALGPHTVLLMEAPEPLGPKPQPESAPAEPFWPFQALLAVEVRDSPADHSVPSGTPTAIDAIENGLETFMALMALDETHADGRAALVKREVAGVPVLSLDPPLPFAAAVDREGHRLILATSSGSIDRYLESTDDSPATRSFRNIQARAASPGQSFAAIDLNAAEAAFQRNRTPIIEAIAETDRREPSEVASDLDQVAAIARILDAVYLSSHLDADKATLTQSLGLLDRQPPRP